MRKRIRKKVLKRAMRKYITGEPLTAMEQRFLERELGYTLAQIEKAIQRVYDGTVAMLATVEKAIRAVFEDKQQDRK